MNTKAQIKWVEDPEAHPPERGYWTWRVIKGNKVLAEGTSPNDHYIGVNADLFVRDRASRELDQATGFQWKTVGEK